MVQKNSFSSESLKFVVHSKVNVKDSGSYVFDSTLSRDSDIVAVSLSSKSIELFSLDTFQNIDYLTGHSKNITDLKFSQQEPHGLYSSSLDGTISLWDIRKGGRPALSYKDDTGEALKPLASFDLNQDERYICAGTEIIHEDAFLIFWDSRTTKLLGGYWNSHTDDIIQVKFHPEKASIMASGSVDGLINVFDLRERTEDDALSHTINTESSVAKMTWFLSDNVEKMCNISHMEEYQIWNIYESQIISTVDRNNLKKPEKVQQVDYLIDTYPSHNTMYLASGTNSGDVDIWTVGDESISSWTTLAGGHKAVVRSLLYNDKSKLFITGGEDGVVCCWKSDSGYPANPSSTKVLPTLKSAKGQHKRIPYAKR